MPSSCVFELNSPRATYFSGETISGTIILNTTKDKNVRDVSIIFLGEGKVKWEETSSTTNSDGSTSSSTTYYKSHEVYVNNSTFVQGDGILPAGRHTWTFNIPLPMECPTSLEGKYGHIRYEITLKICRYYRFDNIYKKPVTIIKTIDLNLNPTYKLPVAMEIMKSLCIWPCSSGKMLITLKVPFGAYAAGQMIKYYLDIKNQSMTDIEEHSIELCKKITFTAKSPRTTQRKTKDILISRTSTDKCLRLTNRIIEGSIYVPTTPPSTNSYDILFVQYKLIVKIYLSGCNSNAEISIPIIIGTIPIRESYINDIVLVTNNVQQQQQVMSVLENTNKTEEAQSSSVVSAPNYEDIDLPTFEEATQSNTTFIDTDTDAHNRIVDFKPLYPKYKT